MEIRNLDGDVIARGDDAKSILKAETSSRIRALQRKSFKRADLRGMDLTDAKICASGDVNSSRRSDFMGADFSGAKLKGAELSGLDLRAANFTGCDMRGVAISLCDMRGACLNEVDMSGYTEDKTGHVSYIMECVLDRVRANDADFQEAQMSAKSADGAVFRDSNFEDAGFKGVWNNATFYSCNLEDTYPGKHDGGQGMGASFGVHLSKDCNTIDMFLKNCPALPSVLPDDHVEIPNEDWDEDGFEVEHPDDLFEANRKSAAADNRRKIYALAEKMMAQDAVRVKQAREAKQQARAAELTASAARREVEAQRLRDVVEAARQQRAKEIAPRIAALPALTGVFATWPVAKANQVYLQRITFSRPLATGYATVRDQGFSVTGGRVTGARRVNRRSDLWELTIQADGSGNISVTTTDFLRGKGGRTLETHVSASIIVN